MRFFLKLVFRVFLLLFVGFCVFYFWASSANLNSKEYAIIKKSDRNYPVQKDTTFSIVTYNIGYLSGMTNNRPIAKPSSLFKNNLQKVHQEFLNVNPDVIAFQEIDYNASRSYNIDQEEAIAKLGYGFSARAINWDKRYLPFPYWPIRMHFGKVISGQSILSKYPLSNQKRIVLESVKSTPFYRNAFYLDRLAQVVKVNFKGKEAILINVHLEAFDQKTREIQFKEVLEVFHTYKNNYPTILLGDFNSEAKDKEAAIQKLFSMDGVGNAAFNVSEIKNTFNSVAPSKRIDYIFYTKNTIELISGRILSEFEQASDHLPVFMKFRFK